MPLLTCNGAFHWVWVVLGDTFSQLSQHFYVVLQSEHISRTRMQTTNCRIPDACLHALPFIGVSQQQTICCSCWKGCFSLYIMQSTFWVKWVLKAVLPVLEGTPRKHRWRGGGGRLAISVIHEDKPHMLGQFRTCRKHRECEVTRTPMKKNNAGRRRWHCTTLRTI